MPKRRDENIASLTRRRVPFGTNEMSSKALFQQRKLYKKLHEGKANTIDFWYEDALYGRVDTSGDAVYPSESKLKQFPGSEGVFALNFVVDAYEGFKREFLSRNRDKKDFTKELFFSPVNLVPKGGWASVNVFYHSQMQSLYEGFTSQYLQSDMDRVRRATTFDRFVELFLKFTGLVAGGSPITRTNIVKSLYCTPNISGLCVEIAVADCSKDYSKHNDLFQSSFFHSYRRTAKRHGFLIDKNVPWRLVADINSQSMQNYMFRHGLDLDNLFERCYLKSYLLDIPALRIYLKQFYDSFLAGSPPINDKFGVRIPREEMSLEYFEKHYPADYWVGLYAVIRNQEITDKLTKKQLNRIIKRTKDIRKSANIRIAVEYLNKKLLGQMKSGLSRTPGSATRTSNLYTAGTEYTYLDGEEYIGFYHIHSTKGPMVGREHSSNRHEKLLPAVGRRRASRAPGAEKFSEY